MSDKKASPEQALAVIRDTIQGQPIPNSRWTPEDLPHIIIDPLVAHPLACELGHKLVRKGAPEGFYERVESLEGLEAHRPRITRLQKACGRVVSHALRRPHIAVYREVVRSAGFARLFTAQVIVSGALMNLTGTNSIAKETASLYLSPHQILRLKKSSPYVPNGRFVSLLMGSCSRPHQLEATLITLNRNFARTQGVILP